MRKLGESSECSAALGIPKVALLFLTPGDMPLEEVHKLSCCLSSVQIHRLACTKEMRFRQTRDRIIHHHASQFLR